MENITIRKATNQDSQNISNLLTKIWKNEYLYNVTKQDFLDLKLIEDNYHKKGGNFLVACFEDKIIGTIACSHLNAKNYALRRVFIYAFFRCHGIGQSLMDMLLANFNSGTALYLSTKEEFAIAAKKFYLKNGFQEIGKEELPEAFPLYDSDNLFMKKII